MRLNPQERKRLLQRRAKRMLERRGFGLKKLQGGGYIVINGETEDALAKFEDIEILGQAFGLWGADTPEEMLAEEDEILRNGGPWKHPPDRDPETGLDTPETAAVREKLNSD